MVQQHFDRTFGATAPENYERFFVPAIGRPMADDLMRVAALEVGERVLDVGCGTGEVLRRLRAKYPNAALAGIDPVPPMLAVAADKLSGNEDLRVGYADVLPWDSASFDLVVSCNMFHYITHPIQALREMARVIRPGGSLVLTDWCDDYLACRICNLYLRMTNRAFYKTYRQAECLHLLRRAGFSDVKLERYKINWLWGLMTAVVTVC